MKKTARAPSNIAFIKFFGKTDEILRLPANSSISMCLSDAYTVTTVEFSSKYKQDDIQLLGGNFSLEEKERVILTLNRLRIFGKSKLFAKVLTQNSFPKSTGIASSASGFAALVKAAVSALRLEMTEKELTIQARLSSGSACRSIPDGFVQWHQGNSSDTSYACSLYPENYWDLRDIIAVVEESSKKVSTSDVHKIALSSPFFPGRIKGIPEKINELKKAFARKDFLLLGKITEEEALNMHAVMMTCSPPVVYFTSGTIEVIQLVWSLRRKEIPVFITLDAGANVHLLCEGKNEKIITKNLKMLKSVRQIIINKPSKGAQLSDKHLF